MAFRTFLRICAFTRRHRGKLIAASSLGLLAAQISHHVFPEQTFRKLYQGWSKGQPLQLSDKLRHLFHEVLEDSCLSPPAGYAPFSAYGFQPVSAGVPWLPGGCLIGIPANYGAGKDGAGILGRVLVLDGKEVHWMSEVGIELRETLTVSVNAEKFSLAREVAHAQIGGPLIQASVAPVCLAGVCLTGVAFKQMLGLYASPMLFRGVFNLLAITVGFTLYIFCSDAVNHWLDYRADRQAAAISEHYARGGLEFYDKILARNRILRRILGKEGEGQYAPNGNLFPKNKLRLKHAPYTRRRDRIQRALASMP